MFTLPTDEESHEYDTHTHTHTHTHKNKLKKAIYVREEGRLALEPEVDISFPKGDGQSLEQVLAAGGRRSDHSTQPVQSLWQVSKPSNE